MNNDLEQFSEKRLRLLTDYSGTNAELQWGEIEAFARIALAAKQAKPVGYIAEVSGNRIGVLRGLPMPEIGSFIHTTPQPAHTEQVIPNGWKLVPIQPTEEMINAWDADMSQSYARVHAEQIGEDEVVFAYQAMLAAAPKPESE